MGENRIAGLLKSIMRLRVIGACDFIDRLGIDDPPRETSRKGSDSGKPIGILLP